MRILHFFKTYYPDAYGGVQQVIYQLAEGAVKRGHEVDVLCLSAENAGRHFNIANHSVHAAKEDFYIASTGFSWSAIVEFRRLAESADIIHYHFPLPYMDIVHFWVNPKKPTVVSYHSDIVKQKYLLQLYKPLMMSFLNKVDAIVASSPNYVKTSPILSSLKKNVEVIPFGLEKVSACHANLSLLNKWNDKIKGRFFLFIGFLRYYKGLSFVLDAMRELDYPLIIIGEGPCEKDLKSQADKLGLRNTFFIGPVSDDEKNILLELCYAVVFPSHLRSEAFGMTLLEASMYGKPMITCEIGTGTTYINLHGETGLAIEPANSDALSSAMKKLWEDQDETERMGKNAKVRFEQNFTADIMIDKYITLYEKAISNYYSS
ncbi:glycosyltransferase family 4 protein [Aeromonas hydrophila]|uniref:Glycosyl transferase, group 1 n=2 Tax=Aeromonas hydrophila TaxID=644 RepID=A0KM97_AERHH|nr:glycosyltransferase family 4 protein [Aeromonas hydrophila]ABK37333.1 glycosyl transferase, group 1 [Aeromonas hydrophila subsp. hydrophila ATCC 7966]MBS4672185.1 glycosyltransferase family 4 protein [Aeromonas hydrophila]OOD36197.1 glycosyl transferase family 1 [Aeromonas hydrophila]